MGGGVELAAVAHARLPERAVHGADLRVDAHLLEHRERELEHVEEGRAGLVDLEDDRDAPPLFVEPVAGRVLFRQDPVEDRIGGVGVVFGVLGRQPLVVERIAGPDRGLGRASLADEDRVDQRLAVDGDRQRLAELAVVEQRVLHRVGMVEIELKDHDVRRGLLQRVEMEAALLLAVEEHGLVGGRADVLVHDVDLALHDLEQQDLGIGDHLVDHAVEIGELRALGVDLPVVGIARRQRPFGVLARGDLELPGVQGRALGVLVVDVVLADAGFAQEEGDPGFEAVLAGERVGVGVVLLVEGLEVMRRGADRLVLVGPGEALEEKPVRLLEGDAEGLLVQHLELAPLAAGGPEALPGGLRHLRVHEDVLGPEADVLGGEGRAVRPFHPLAELEGIDPAAIADLEGFRDVGLDGRPVGGEADQRLVALIAHDHGQRAAADQRVLPVAALLARPVGRGDDHRVLRQALGQRRQLARVDDGLERGRFLRRGRPGLNPEGERPGEGRGGGKESPPADLCHRSSSQKALQSLSTILQFP